MSQLTSLNLQALHETKQIIEGLAKSFPSAGYQNLSAGGRVGLGALSVESLEDMVRSITIEDKDFMLIKDIPTQAIKSTVHSYRIKTGIGDHDVAGFENFMPGEVSSTFMTVSEVLKVYGTMKTMGHMTEAVNAANGYVVDLNDENEKDAALLITAQMERDFYHGGDYFLDSNGNIDGNVAAQLGTRLRQVRGIQANVREGDKTARGIPLDWEATHANRSVVKDQAGAALNRTDLDSIVSAVGDAGNLIREGHTTSECLRAFRASLFPIERADINTAYMIRGSGITNDEHQGVPVETIKGTVMLIANRFKYYRDFPVPRGQSSLPNTPAVALAMGGASVSSGFIAGQVFRYRVQAVNINGMSVASASQSITIGAGQDGYPVDITITNAADVEYYAVYRTVANAAAGTSEMFVGNILKAGGASTVFRDAGKIRPGLSTMLLVPKDKNRAKMLTLGSMMDKLELGRQGLALQTIYVSYLACMVQAPRAFGLLDNVYQEGRV